MFLFNNLIIPDQVPFPSTSSNFVTHNYLCSSPQFQTTDVSRWTNNCLFLLATYNDPACGSPKCDYGVIGVHLGIGLSDTVTSIYYWIMFWYHNANARDQISSMNMHSFSLAVHSSVTALPGVEIENKSHMHKQRAKATCICACIFNTVYCSL